MSNAVPYFLLLLQIATRPWSPDQGKTREMTKLCNHKRKLLLPCAAASPVAASCTLPVSPSTLSSGPTSSTAAPTAAAAPIHADSPTSPDKARKGTRPILLRLSVSPCLLFFFLFFFLLLFLRLLFFGDIHTVTFERAVRLNGFDLLSFCHKSIHVSSVYSFEQFF